MVADVVVRPVDHWPELGSLQFVSGLDVHSGGCALNTGIALHALGWEVRVEGQVGDDILGDYLLRVVKRHGMATSGIRRVSAGTAGSVALVTSGGERTFLHYIGSNRIDQAGLKAWQRLPSARHLHVGGAFLLPGLDGEPMADMLQTAHGMGMTTSVDTAYDFSGQWMDLIRPVLPHVDYFLPSYLEAKAMTGESDPERQARHLLEAGVQTVGIKLGDQGALIATQPGGPGGFRAWPVAPLKVAVVDTTGAGDSWVAGFLDGVLRGWGLPAAALWGNAEGAACVQATGASTGVLDRAGLLSLLGAQGRGEEFDRLRSHGQSIC